LSAISKGCVERRILVMGAIEEFNSAESGAEEAALRISARWAVDELGFP